MARATRGRATIIGRLSGTTYLINAPDGTERAPAVARVDLPLYVEVEVQLTRDASGGDLWLISAVSAVR